MKNWSEIITKIKIKKKGILCAQKKNSEMGLCKDKKNQIEYFWTCFNPFWIEFIGTWSIRHRDATCSIHDRARIMIERQVSNKIMLRLSHRI